MRIAISYTAPPPSDPAAAIAAAKAARAAGVEARYATAESRWLLSETGHGADLAAKAKAAGVEVCDLYLGFLCVEPALIGRTEIVRRAQQAVRQALEVAAEAGVKLVTLPFFGRNCIETDEEFDRACAALGDGVDAAAESGVVLAVESTLNVDRQREMLNTLGGPGEVKAHFNTGAALARKLDAATGIRDLGREALGIIRLRDVRVGEALPPNFDVALGEGDVDFSAAAQALRAIGYEGWLLVEPSSAGGATAAVEFVAGLLK